MINLHSNQSSSTNSLDSLNISNQLPSATTGAANSDTSVNTEERLSDIQLQHSPERTEQNPHSEQSCARATAMRLPEVSENAVRGHFLKYARLADINFAESPVPHNEDIFKSVSQKFSPTMPGYNSPQGLPQVVEATKSGLTALYNLQTETDNIMINGGASEAIPSILRSHLTPGDTAIIASPCFLPTGNFCQEAAIFPVEADTSADNYRLSAERLTETLQNNPNAKALILSDPGNPTGTVMEKSEYQALLDTLAAREADFLIIQDAPYAHQTITRPFTALAGMEAPPNVKLFSIFTLSKAGGSGFRVGATVTNDPQNLQPLIKRMSIKGPSIATPSQFAWQAFMSPVSADNNRLVAADISSQQKGLIQKNLTLVKALCQQHNLNLVSDHEGGSYCLLDLGDKKGLELFDSAMEQFKLLVMPGSLTNLEQRDSHFLRLPLTLPDASVYRNALELIGRLVNESP